jgi:hypothetical protein
VPGLAGFDVRRQVRAKSISSIIRRVCVGWHVPACQHDADALPHRVNIAEK